MTSSTRLAPGGALTVFIQSSCSLSCGAQRLSHLFLKNLLKRALNKIANHVAPASSSDLNSANFDLLCIPVMVSFFPIKGMFDSETNGHTMTELQ